MQTLSSVLTRSLWLRIPLYLLFLPSLLHLALSLYWLAYIFAWSITDPIERVRWDLNNARLMSEARRCYIYSEEDPMVDFHDVEAHASEAVHRGFTVQ